MSDASEPRVGASGRAFDLDVDVAVVACDDDHLPHVDLVAADVNDVLSDPGALVQQGRLGQPVELPVEGRPQDGTAVLVVRRPSTASRSGSRSAPRRSRTIPALFIHLG